MLTIINLIDTYSVVYLPRHRLQILGKLFSFDNSVPLD